MLATVRRSNGLQCALLAAVVMDDHTHILGRIVPGKTCKELASTLKSVSAHSLTRAYGRSAPVWQREYFDRWMTTPDGIAAADHYIRLNPARRWPGIEGYPWLLP